MPHFLFDGHKINVQEVTGTDHIATCETASIPYVIAKACSFMLNYNVHVLVIDGKELYRER